VGQVLSVSALEKVYEVRKTAFSLKKTIIKPVNKISFGLEEGQTLGIVGESGSGKSTLARCLVMLEKPDGGVIHFYNQNIFMLKKNNLKDLRKKIQIIFQDPYSSLNPRMKVFSIIAEPLVVHKLAAQKEISARVLEVLKSVGINEDFLDKYPHEMSGGQRQRVAIGRALVTNPALLVADEPVSSLDVSIQAQIINLFNQIKKHSMISMIFISHDLNVVRYVADKILVMYKGKILEMGTKDDVFFQPRHPYTRMLLSATQGGLHQCTDIARGFPAQDACVYYERCEVRKEICEKKMPKLDGTEEHAAACFISSN